VLHLGIWRLSVPKCKFTQPGDGDRNTVKQLEFTPLTLRVFISKVTFAILVIHVMYATRPNDTPNSVFLKNISKSCRLQNHIPVENFAIIDKYCCALRSCPLLCDHYLQSHELTLRACGLVKVELDSCGLCQRSLLPCTKGDAYKRGQNLGVYYL
jgi:hypothetical protein